MTAPARVSRDSSAGTVTRTRTALPPRERGIGKPARAQPERASKARGRSVAAEHAYTRRAERARRAVAEVVGIKVERRSGSASRVSFVVLIMALLTGGVVATLWFATQATADAYRLEQARKSTGQLSVQVDQLRQRVAAEDSAPSLANRARQLGMVPAGDPAHLVVGTNGTVTVIGTPSAVPSPAPPPPPPTTAPSASTSPTTAAPTTPTTAPPITPTTAPPTTAPTPSTPTPPAGH